MKNFFSIFITASVLSVGMATFGRDAEWCIPENASYCQVVDIYDAMEANLIVRYRAELAQFSTNIETTIRAIGATASLRASELLMENIDVVPSELPLLRNGTPVPRIGSAMLAAAPENIFVSGLALRQCLIPVQTCLRHYNAADSSGKFLCRRVGVLCHGQVFSNLVCDTNSISESAELRLRTTDSFNAETSVLQLSNVEIINFYGCLESNLLERLECSVCSNKINVLEPLQSLGYIRSRKSVEKLLPLLEHPLSGASSSLSSTPEDCYPVVKALAEIGMPFCESLDLIDSAEPGSLRERLLVRLAELSHGFVFTNYVHSFGSGPTNRYSRIISEYGL